ncbi:hypothetical protein QJS66_00115 [Kocuria rhizophila]|nr:hypothetical protein QJS66_00115 [Kocuria rhizophila]
MAPAGATGATVPASTGRGSWFDSLGLALQHRRPLASPASARPEFELMARVPRTSRARASTWCCVPRGRVRRRRGRRLLPRAADGPQRYPHGRGWDRPPPRWWRVLAGNALLPASARLSDDALLQACSLEGHPENAAPHPPGGPDDLLERRKGISTVFRRPAHPATCGAGGGCSGLRGGHCGGTAGRFPKTRGPPQRWRPPRAGRAARGGPPGHPELLLDATHDLLHQPYRAQAMAPAAGQLVTGLRERGHAALISGAGPHGADARERWSGRERRRRRSGHDRGPGVVDPPPTGRALVLWRSPCGCPARGAKVEASTQQARVKRLACRMTPGRNSRAPCAVTHRRCSRRRLSAILSREAPPPL